MLYLINPSGAIVEVPDQERFQAWQLKGFRVPNQSQIDQYERSRAIMHKKMTTSDEGSDVYFCSVAPGNNGFGVSSRKLKEQLLDLGVRFSEQQRGQKIGFLYHHPYSITRLDNSFRIIYTMFESSRIPQDWKEYLAAADLILVPSKFCAEVFAREGFNTRIVPLGFDDQVFAYVDRPIKRETHEPFYFLHYDAFNKRKGFQELWKAFVMEFDPSEPVKMIFKTTRKQAPLPIMPSQYPNIEILTGETTDSALAALCAKADAFVFPSMGEGFGITPLEAMGTGLPTIVPDAHGISEYFNSEYMYPVTYHHDAPAIYARYKDQDVGKMVVCDVEDLRRQMRYIYEHEQEAKQKGKEAAQYVRQWTFKKTAEQLKIIFDEYLAKEVQAGRKSNILATEAV
jgi:glycosyltransferase involved in cell wall biosynthesis